MYREGVKNKYDLGGGFVHCVFMSDLIIVNVDGYRVIELFFPNSSLLVNIWSKILINPFIFIFDGIVKNVILLFGFPGIYWIRVIQVAFTVSY